MVKNILALIGVGVVGVACFAYGAISLAVVYGRDGCVTRDTGLGEATLNLTEALDGLKSEPHGELS